MLTSYSHTFNDVFKYKFLSEWNSERRESQSFLQSANIQQMFIQNLENHLYVFCPKIYGIVDCMQRIKMSVSSEKSRHQTRVFAQVRSQPISKVTITWTTDASYADLAQCNEVQKQSMFKYGIAICLEAAAIKYNGM